MNSRVWPRLILGALLIATLVYLWQALRGEVAEAGIAGRGEVGGGGLLGWVARYRNALTCYALFLGFLLTLPILGMLIGGVLFVFLALTVLGPPTLRLVPLHAAIALGTVGAMWAVFTFGLRVFLPEGILISIQ